MSDIARKLAEPFDPDIVSWRVGSVSAEKKRGMALAYIDARDVMRRLDEVCGPENWQDEYPWSDGKRVVCRIGIRIGAEWVWKTDGAGDTDYEGEKGALSDAFKRAAVKWGVGRYLYDVAAPWVAVEQRGKTWIIADGEEVKLRSRLPRRPADTRSAPSQPPVNGAATQAIANGRLPANPEEPPSVAAARDAARAAFWSRDSYAIDPEVIHGGLARWDAEYLAQAAAAPNIDTLEKLKNDNKEAGFVERWEAAVATPVIKHFRTQAAAIAKRLESSA